ncbi:SID1 transmembrane family member 1-like isoform X2 [Liolophura sinensis]
MSISSQSHLIYVDVSSMTKEWTEYTLLAWPVDSFQLEEHESKVFSVTPSEPSFFRYTFPDGVDSLVVLASSDSPHCAILSVQDTKCPVFEMDNNVKFRGMYQTMTTKAAITVKRSDFSTASFFVVLVLQANNRDCTTIESILPRVKNITLTTKKTMPASEYVTAIVIAVVVFAGFYMAAVLIACFYHICDKNWGIPDLSEAERNDGETWVITRPREHSYGSIHDETIRQRELGELSNAETSATAVGESDSSDSLDTTDIDLLHDADEEKEVVRTKTFLYVADLARKSRKSLAKRYKLYHWNLVTIAIFYGLPVVQLVITYQQVLHLTGDEDICYYNFECAHPLGVLSAFNNVFSNIGYVLLGILFLILVWRRDLIHRKAVQRQDRLEKYYGIPQHFGLFYAMGWALCMEGLMSACYHVCPNYSNFQFDTSFMYVIACLDMLKIYQIRHPDINAKAHAAYLAMALIIFIAVIGVVYGTKYFWIVFAVLHISSTFLLSVQIYYMGRWKLNLGIFKRTFLLLRTDCCSRPMYPGRMALICLVNFLNWGLAIYGVLTKPEDFASYLLAILIVNLMLYVAFYIVMKLVSKEKIMLLPLMFIILSAVLMGFALWFFLNHLTSWNLTPAKSREQNQPCILMDFYDSHDVWHFLSAMSLFFSFMILLTLDDDLTFTRRDRIPVF